MHKNKSKKTESISNFLFELALIFLQSATQAFVRYLVVVGFILLSLGGYILTDRYYIWGVFLLAVFGLWKLFDLLDAVIESLLARTENGK